MRTELVIAARQAVGTNGHAYDSISIGALGFADVSSIFDSVWSFAQDAFDGLVIAIEQWDELADDDEPYTSAIFPEEGVRAIGWDADRWNRCQIICLLVDRIIWAGIISHLPTYTVEKP
jgi:hypothetical protein